MKNLIIAIATFAPIICMGQSSSEYGKEPLYQNLIGDNIAIGKFSLYQNSATATTDTTRTIGYTIGNQTVISIPVAPAGYATAQALVYYPDDYFLAKNANKKYPLYIFLHGAGEGVHNDITEVTNQSLPFLIKNGLKPYAIDSVTKDTVKFIVISPHCALCGGSYSFPQLKYTLPYLLANYRIDTSVVCVGGLSSGGSCTWSMIMGDGSSNNTASYNDTTITKKVTHIMPMANGGYDENITKAICKSNLEWWLKKGGNVFYVIGNQDAGYNQTGYGTYTKEDSIYGLPGHWFHDVIVGGTHSANVWNTPFPLNARDWSKIKNAWQQLWDTRRTFAVKVVLKSIPHARVNLDSVIINYPNSIVRLNGDSSFCENGTIIDHYYVITTCPKTPLLTQDSISNTIYVSGIVPGLYAGKFIVTDSLGNKDSTFFTFKLNAVSCPVCPACPPIPAPRTPTQVNYIWDGTKWVGTFKYNDGSN